jgi:MFS transporter, ACS family, glucarate transporter
MGGLHGHAEGWARPREGRGLGPVRYRVLAFTVALAGITYLDRVCIAKMAPDIQRDLHLSDERMGIVFSAFTLAYALFEIPTGAWGDRIGTRRVLTRIVAWWSTFTIATAAAAGYVSLLITRFLFGVGEAGAFPNVSRTLSRWFPASERGKAQGIFFAGAHLGGGLTPPLVAALMGFMSWRAIFVAFGCVGFVWAVCWALWFRDEPADHPAVGPGELAFIEEGRAPLAPHRLDAAILRRIVTDRSLVALCLMYFTQAYGFYFNLTWFPTYLARVRGFSGMRLGLLAGLPLILSAVADVLGGLTTDRVSRRFGLRAGRCGVGGAALLVAGSSLIAGVTARDAITSALLISLAGAAASFLLGACWGVCLDIAGPHAGLVTACMNSSGQVGAVISPVILPILLNRTNQNWSTPLYMAGALYCAGAVCWLLVDPRRPIALHPEKPSPPEAGNDDL